MSALSTPERIELKPCPFCGGSFLKSGGDDKMVGTWCMTCEASGPNQYGKTDWNTRAPSPEVAALREALSSAIHHLKSAEKDTNYAFDPDFTPESERLVPRLQAVLAASQKSEWVCEAHPDKAWPEECNCSAGMLREDAQAPVPVQAPDDGWRSIESAPKGEKVDLWVEDRKTPTKPKYYRFTNAVFNGQWMCGVGFLAPHVTPTHWRPLPAPPVAANNNGEKSRAA
jgi:hypothetical protein